MTFSMFKLFEKNKIKDKLFDSVLKWLTAVKEIDTELNRHFGVCCFYHLFRTIENILTIKFKQ